MNFPLLRRLPLLAVLLILGLPTLTRAATFNVPSTAYPTIQSGINAAQSGDTVLVADGIFTGDGNRDIDLLGKSLTVTSLNGPAKTIIDCGGYASTDGSGNHRGFYIHSGETSAVISGFTVKNGFQHYTATIPHSGNGGGIFIGINGTSTIANCTFIRNTVDRTGGGAFIENDGVNNNNTIINSTFYGNTATDSGGAFIASYYGTVTITTCTFSSNTSQGAGNGGGAGIYTHSSQGAVVTNCTFTGNSALYGGGTDIQSPGANVTNCTFTGNTARSGSGGGLFFDDLWTGTATNCIFRGDIGGEIGSLSASQSITFSDIQGGYVGTGNIDADPLFVNVAAGDLHLKPGSPCLDAGTPNGAPPTDLDGRTRPGRPSMGAYELGTTLNVPSQYPTIQAGIDAARPGDTVLVADGTYTGDGNRDIDFHGKNLTVKSVNGPAKTVIDCGGYASTDGSGNHRGVYVHSGETSAEIDGFTVKNGYQTFVSNTLNSDNGGGICVDGSSVIIQNCTVTGNIALGSGGGVYNVNGSNNSIIRNCAITKNAASSGGGVTNYNGSGSIAMADCTVSDNTATGSSGGGGIYNSNNAGNTILLTNCAVFNNTTYGLGGGVCDLNNGSGSIAMTNCTLSRNTASLGGGGVLNQTFNSNGISDGGIIMLTNCTVTSNKTGSSGSGILNDISRGGNIHLTNDVVYADIGGGEVKDYAYSTSDAIVSYCDVQGGSLGTSNINADPQFVNAASGDLHLKPGSPCLGAGTPNGAPATDLDGTPRPNPPSMGAYELPPAPATITAFTLSPSQVAAIGPNITVVAAVTASGTFGKVTASPAPGMLGSASPTFTLTNSGAAWTGVIPTAYLKLARVNPITFIATGTRADGTTATATATLIVGALPALSLAVSPPARNVARLQRVNFTVTVSNPSLTVASLATVTVSLPDHVTLVSAPNFQYDGVKTLTYQGTLGTVSNFGSNLKVLPFTVEIVSGTPSNTQLPFPVKATCSNFQEADSIPILTVDGDVAPLGVAVDASGGFGILDGDAQVDLAQGNTPLHATLTPKTSLSNLFQLFGSTHRASIYFEVFVSKTGQADFKPGGDPTSAFLAQNGLMSPSVSPSYDATFTTINDSISISTSFTPRAAVLTLADVFLTALALKTKKPVPSIDFLFKVSQNLAQLSAFGSAANEFTASRPKNTVQVLQAVARATKDLVSISGPEKQLLITILKQYNLVDDNFTIDGVQKVLGFAFATNTLLHVAADSFTITIQTGGQPMVVQFDATSSKK